MQFPNRLQSVLLFEAPVDVLERAVRDFARIEEMKTGAIFSVPETRPGRFCRLANSDEGLMLTAEYIHGPANPDAFGTALGSAIIGMIAPDIRDRIAKTRSHIILEVSHAPQGDDEAGGGTDVEADIEADIGAVDRDIEGADGSTQEQFHRRVDLLALFSRVVTDHATPLAVHWTQSDMLLDPDTFETLAAIEAPGPLHIHPVFFGPAATCDEPAQVGIRTIGASHWLGREIVVEPNALPWAANYETVLAFLRLATLPNGNVVPDGDTFGPEDASASTLVSHRESGDGKNEGQGEGAAFVLTPLKHDEFGFVAPDYVWQPDPVRGAITSDACMAKGCAEPASLEASFRESRKMAQALSGSLGLGVANNASPASEEDVASVATPMPTPSTSGATSLQPPMAAPKPSQPGRPTVSGRGLRAKVFGRKQA